MLQSLPEGQACLFLWQNRHTVVIGSGLPGDPAALDCFAEIGTWLTHPENLGTYVRMLRKALTPMDAYRYLAQNPDVAASKLNPLTHYETYGWREGRNPSLLFSTRAYQAGKAMPAALVTPPEGGSFSDVLARTAAETVNTVRQGDRAALAGLTGSLPVQQVVEATMAMESAVQVTVAIRDRVVEMAALLVLGPIFEADLLRNQYGFRPGLDAKMAVRQAFWHVADHGLSEVVDADLSDRVRARLGLDFARANVLEIENGTLTGRLIDRPWGDIVDGAEKRRVVLEVCELMGIAPAQAIAVGDGANDLPMMGAVGLSIAFHPKPAVLEQAMLSITSGGMNRALEAFDD